MFFLVLAVPYFNFIHMGFSLNYCHSGRKTDTPLLAGKLAIKIKRQKAQTKALSFANNITINYEQTCAQSKPNQRSFSLRDFDITVALDNNINLLTHCKVLWWDRHKRLIIITMNSRNNRCASIARSTK